MQFFTDERPPSILDVEASGFGKDSYPIEVGYVDENTERFCRLICPLDNWTHWSDSAEDAHGIARPTLFEQGITAREIALLLNQRLQGKTLYSDGWVVDHPWLIKLFSAVNIEPRFLLSPIEMILKEPQMEIWDETRKKLLQQHSEKRHRASFDAYIIQQTWIETYRLTH